MRLLEQLGDVARVYPRAELIGRMSGGTRSWLRRSDRG